MTSCVLSSSFYPLHIFHGFLHSSSLEVFFESWRCLHLGEAFNILSTHTYDGEGKVSFLEHLYNFIFMIYEEDHFFDEHIGLLLAYTLRKSPFLWVLSLSVNIVHSFENLCEIIEDTFYHFYLDYLDWKLLQQWRAPHGSIIDFWQCFRNL